MKRRSRNMKSAVLLLCLFILQAHADQGYWVGPGIKVGANEENPHVEEDDRLEKELELLLGVEQDRGIRPTRHEVRPTTPEPTLPKVLLECSNKETHPYGCCSDKKTKATQQDKYDCGPKMCQDISVVYCHDRKKAGTLICEGEEGKRCAHTCKNCIGKAQASPLDKCRTKGYLFGCCWNGQPALRPGGVDCPPCRDFSRACKQFYWSDFGGCNSPSYGIRRFMDLSCARTCGICDYSYTKK